MLYYLYHIFCKSKSILKNLVYIYKVFGICLVTQSCPVLCNPMDYNTPSSSVHGILQARILEWVAVPFSGDLPHPGIKPGAPELQADSLPTEPSGKSQSICYTHI